MDRIFLGIVAVIVASLSLSQTLSLVAAQSILNGAVTNIDIPCVSKSITSHVLYPTQTSWWLTR
jgi:hypothetical protein